MNSEERQIRYEQIFNSFVNKLKEKKPTVLSIAKAKSDANAKINLLKKQQTNEKDKNEKYGFTHSVHTHYLKLSHLSISTHRLVVTIRFPQPS